MITLDIDLYQFHEEPLDLSGFKSLQFLTISPRMVVGDDEDAYLKHLSSSKWSNLLPPNLHCLTFRGSFALFPISQIYEAISIENLQIKYFDCQMYLNSSEDGPM